MRLVELFEQDQILEVTGELNESFFSDNHDILMPIVRGLMQTAARALIYKVWKKSPNAVKALAAIKKLHDQGDEHPLWTINKETDLDVPIKFLQRLGQEAGLGYIPDIGDRAVNLARVG